MPGRRTISPGDGDSRHGSVNGYKNLGCGCEACTAAWADYSRRWVEADPLRRKRHREANRRRPEPVLAEPEITDPAEEPYVFARPPVVPVELTAEVRLAPEDERLLPWITERLDVLRYYPNIRAYRSGDQFVVRATMSFMPVEAAEAGWPEKVLAEAVEWARGDPRLACGG